MLVGLLIEGSKSDLSDLSSDDELEQTATDLSSGNKPESEDKSSESSSDDESLSSLQHGGIGKVQWKCQSSSSTTVTTFRDSP